MARQSPVRARIREALNAMPTVASTEQLARVAINNMSDNERYMALMALLPRLIREEDRRRTKLGEPTDDDEAWVAATERRVWLNGEDMFLADADRDQVLELATIRERAAGNIGVAADRFRALADVMQRQSAETVAGVSAVGGLAALRLQLRSARQRLASRNALMRLRAQVDELSESPDLTAAREALDGARERLAAAQAEAETHRGYLATARMGLPESLHILIDRTESHMVEAS